MDGPVNEDNGPSRFAECSHGGLQPIEQQGYSRNFHAVFTNL